MKGNSLSDQIYEDLVMRRCSHCAHTRVYRLSDGRVKCWACIAFEEQLREPFGGASHGI